MKWLIISIFCIYNGAAYAQSESQQVWSDTGRVLNLREIAVSAKSKSQTDRLADFYRGNLASTLEDVLARLPEVTMVKRGAYGLEPTLRSFSGSQVNVLVDGMRIHGACTDKMDPATIYIEPENLGSIEVQTGNRGFTSGSAIGGSFNLKIEEPEYGAHRVNGILSSGFHSVSRGLFESVGLNYGAPRFALRATATYRDHQNYEAGKGKEILFSQYKKVNYSAGAKLEIGRNFHLRADFIGDDGFNIGYPALPMDVGYASARIGAITLNKKGSGRLREWQLKLYGNYIRHFMDDTHRPEVYMHMDMPGSSKTLGFFSEASLNVNKRNSVQLRVDGSSTNLHASMTMYDEGAPPMYMLTWPDNRRNQWGASASWYFEASKFWQFRVNGRTDLFRTRLTTRESKDHVQIFSERVNGTNHITGNFSVEATRIIDNTWRLSASAGIAERMPSANEQYGFYLFNANDGYDYIGNPGLKTERVMNGEANVQFRKGNNRAKFSAFISNVSNYITAYTDASLSTMTYGANGVKRYRNERRALIAGFEGSAFISLAPAVGYVSTVRYVYGRNNHGGPLPGITPLKNYQTVQWSKNKCSLKMEAEIAAPQKRINKGSGEDQTQGYGLLHFRASFKMKVSGCVFELQPGVENIFNTTYHEHNDWGNILRPGRNIVFQAKVNF